MGALISGVPPQPLPRRSRFALAPKLPSSLPLSTPATQATFHNTANKLKKQPEITIDFPNLIARKMATNAHKADNTSAIRHSENRSSSTSHTSVPSEELNSLRQQLVVLSTRLGKCEAQSPQQSASSMVSGSENSSAASASRPKPVTSDQPPTSMPLFGLPAVTIHTPSAKPEAQLHQRNILWTSVTSAGQQLPLPLDSCCSVSLVSKVHADYVASKRPDLTYHTLEEPISVTAADPKSNLKAVSTMQIPITWETGTETVFTMLVVPGLVWPILFGENHLHATHALVDHHVPSITFWHPSMQFHVQCSLDNSLNGFESNRNSCTYRSLQKKHLTCASHDVPTLAVESKLKKTTIAENIILGVIRDDK